MKKKCVLLIFLVLIIMAMLTIFVACNDDPTCTVTYLTTGDVVARVVEATAGAKLENPTVPTKEGYVFVAWRNAEDNSIWNFDENTVTKDTVLYAEWKKCRHQVIFDSCSGAALKLVTVEDGNKLEEPIAPTKEGYTFLSWKNAADNTVWNFDENTVTSDIVLFADWEKVAVVNNFFVIIDYKNGNAIQPQIVKEGSVLEEPEEPTKEGYAFVAWKNAANNTVWDFENDTVDENTLIYAEWEKLAKYKVKWDSLGFKETEEYEVYEGTKLMAVEQKYPTTGDSRVLRWIDADTGETWDFDTMTVGKDTHLRAIWKIHVLTYDTFLGTGNYINFEVTTDTSVTEREMLQIMYGDFGDMLYDPEGYTYSWTINGKEVGLVDGKLILSEYIKSVSINSTPKRFKVLLNYNGTSGWGGAPVEVEVTYGKSYKLPTPLKEGYTFLGWFEAEDPASTQYTDGNGDSLKAWRTANSHLVLYAVFEKNSEQSTTD